MTRVAMKFNNRTGRYRKFGTAKLGDMTDPNSSSAAAAWCASPGSKWTSWPTLA